MTAAVRGGLTDIVVCPGSRSQALALVAAELERVGAIRLHVRIDERSAGFFALGLALETGRATAVVTTSGTAVANLHPAMLEAFHAGVPLVAVTADRPPELLGVGANQATVQPGVFGSRIACVDVAPPSGEPAEGASARELGLRVARASEPLHVNIAFRDPLGSAVPELGGLLPVLDEERRAVPEPAAAARTPSVRRIDPADGVPTLVVAGAGAGADAERIAFEGGWPLVAEPSSGARFGRNLVVGVDELLGDASPIAPLRDAIARVLVFGHPTLTRVVPALLQRDGVEAIGVGSSGGEDYSPGHSIVERVDRIEIVPPERSRDADPVIGADGLDVRGRLRGWVVASRRLLAEHSSDPAAPDLAARGSTEHAVRSRFARQELAVARGRVDRDVLVDAVWRAMWPHDRLVLGASSLIRVLDGRAPGKPIRVFANRGLAGIDGTIATGLGVATASQRSDEAASAAGVTRILLGDLTLLHDASSLLVGQGGEVPPRVQVIVGDDRGGSIFEGLEVAGIAPPDAFERVQRTPQEVDLASLAAAYGWAYVRAETRSALEGALTSHEADRVIVHVPLPRD
nr:2-succinyl-5-enolpyruvyl-6-hydroxy-3-cyclohexene-1-carboxylate synthase [Pseudoclavibacter chungangensis]